MRNPYQRKAASKQAPQIYNVQDIYKQFIETIVSQGHVFALLLKMVGRFVLPLTGQRAFAIWQSKGLAKLLIKDNSANYRVEEISLKDFVEKVIPFLRQEATNVSLDLTPEGQNILVAPEKLLLDLKNYLYQVYIQKPEFFKEMQIPLPRSIRLN